jgi:hypothetical protein
MDENKARGLLETRAPRYQTDGQISVAFHYFTEDVVRFTRWTGEQELGLHTHLLGETAY